MIITSRLRSPYNTRVTLLQLEKRISQNAGVDEIEGGWRLVLESSRVHSYRLAQLDDYGRLPRAHFPHQPEVHLSLLARASQNLLPGTWGFGFWNDPFGFSLGLGGTKGRWPALPNAAWFFFASPENYLAFHDGLPGNGPMVAVYRSRHVPAPFMAFNLPLLPLLAWRPSSRWLRRRASQFIRQESEALDLDPSHWHQYSIIWKKDSVNFAVDDRNVLSTHLSPLPLLGLVLWIDNQYAAWPPDGRMRYGTLPTPANCWVEIKDLHLD